MFQGDWYLVAGFICLVIGVLGGFLVTIGWNLRNREIDAMKGQLTVPTIDFSKPFKLYWGGIVFVKNVSQLAGALDTSNFFNVGGGITLRIRFDSDKVLISAEIRNDSNQTIVKIVDNNWVVNTDPMIAYDRNFNDYAFEVIDSDQMPRLQVLMKENNVIYVGGYFDTVIGKVLAVPHELVIGPPPQMVEQFKKMRLFKYPSQDNFGQIIEPLPDYQF